MTKFLSRRRRTANMNIITDIYLHVRPVYMDDWLSTTFVETDHTKEFELEEQKQRQEVESWHKQRYNAPTLVVEEVKKMSDIALSVYAAAGQRYRSITVDSLEEEWHAEWREDW